MIFPYVILVWILGWLASLWIIYYVRLKLGSPADEKLELESVGILFAIWPIGIIVGVVFSLYILVKPILKKILPPIW